MAQSSLLSWLLFALSAAVLLAVVRADAAGDGVGVQSSSSEGNQGNEAVPCSSSVSVCVFKSQPSSEETSNPRKTTVGECGKVDTNPLVKATFDSVSTLSGGWPILRVNALEGKDEASRDPAVVMRAAGWAEGFLTHRWIDDMHRRVRMMRSASSRKQLRAFIAAQITHIRAFAASTKEPAKDDKPAEGTALSDARYRRLVSLFLSQLDGLLEGYKQASSVSSSSSSSAEKKPHPQPLELLDLLELNYDGDAFDILQAAESGISDFTASASSHLSRFRQQRATRRRAVRSRSSISSVMTQEAESDSLLEDDGYSPVPASPLSSLPSSTFDLESWVKLSARGRCTAAVIAKDGLKKLWVAHNTWADYLELLRCWKVYSGLPLSSSSSSPLQQQRRVVSFSSYPGMIASTDDWYQINDKEAGVALLVTETTTSAVNARALSPIHPSHGLPAWLRVLVANAVATNGPTWSSAFSLYNGGTYNCMWAVVDATKAKEAAGSDSGNDGGGGDGVLTIVEQSPQRILAVDATETLRTTGLWVSANRPSLTAIRKDLGYPEEDGKEKNKKKAAAAEEEATVTATTTTEAGEGDDDEVVRPASAVTVVASTLGSVGGEGSSSSASSSASSKLPRFASTSAAAAVGSQVEFEPSFAHYHDRGVEAHSSDEAANDQHWADGLRFKAAGRAGEQLMMTPSAARSVASSLSRFADAELELELEDGAEGEAEAEAEGTAEADAAEDAKQKKKQQQRNGGSKGNGKAPAKQTRKKNKKSSKKKKASVPAAYFSSFNSPRARILQRELAAVVSDADVKRVIRHNKWQDDPESQGRPYLAVSARFDLAKEDDPARAANGALDAKVASLSDLLAGRTMVILGPTTDDQPPFDWAVYGESLNKNIITGKKQGKGGHGERHKERAEPLDWKSLCQTSAGGESDKQGGSSDGCPVDVPCKWAFAWGEVKA